MADLEDVTLDGRPLQSLRVADLKAALDERGLSKSGHKNALMKRLKGALMLENLQRTSTAHIGLQPNSQIGEEMSQNSFIKQYLAKQQELLRQRLEREAREAYDTNEPEDHTEVNNSTSCPPQAQDATPALAEQYKPPGPSGGEALFVAVNDGEGHRNQEADVSGPPASGSVAFARVSGGPERESASNEAAADSDDDDDSEDGEEDGDDDDWESGARRRSHREPARAPTSRERSGASCQPPQQHMPSLLSPQLRQPTPPPSPPPELSFPLPDTPKQSPPSPDVAPARRSSSTSSSGSSSSGSRSSSPEPQRSGHAERKPGPLTLLARKMESEGAFSGAGWHRDGGVGDRQDSSSGLVSAITHTASTAGHVSFPTIPGTNQGITGAHSAHIQVPVSVLKATAAEERDRERDSEKEREKALELERQERQRKLEQERVKEEERERALALEREERERALEKERIERQQALEREEREKALQRERELALERERQERELALAKEREERERALARERALELERQKELERQRALEQERLQREKREREDMERAKELERAKALEQERKERERALEQERLQRERALEAERKEKERIEREKALEQERLERERLEREKALEQERLEMERALEQDRLEREKALERERIERDKALEKQRLEMERALEKERLEREKALEQERLEREKALELERLRREKALERERIERERALEQQRLELERKEKERIEKEKALEQERIEKEKALKREREEKERLEREEQERKEKERAEKERKERLDREKALEQEKLERERALEKERLEREKALEQEKLQKEKERAEKERKERLEREKALEQEKLQKEKETAEKERLEREKALEQEKLQKEKERKEKLEREKALEQEKLERERALEKEKERALEQERLEKEKAMQKEKEEQERALEQEKERARMAEKERESHLPPSKRGREIGLTPLPTPPPLSTGPGRKSSTEAREQEDVHAPMSWSEAAVSGAPMSPTPLLPQSSFKKFRFLRDSPIQSSSPSMVIKRPRNFSDTPQPRASPASSLTDVGQRQQEGLQSSAEQDDSQKRTSQEVAARAPGSVGAQAEKETTVSTTLVPSPKKEGTSSPLSEDKEKADAVKSQQATKESTKKATEVDEKKGSTKPVDTAQRRGRDTKKEEKRARQRSSSNDSSSSESDSGSSSSGSSSSSTSSQEKTSSTSRGRREGKPKRDSSPQHRVTREAQAGGLKETPKASLSKREKSVEKSNTTADGDGHTKPFIEAPTREETQRKRKDTEGEEEAEKNRQVKETAMADPEKLQETSEETPKAFSARKISISSSKSSPGTGSAEGEQDSGAAAGRKRRWGSSTAVTAKKPSISITTDSLKSLIPDIRPSLGQEAVVDLHPEEAVLSGAEDEERERSDQDLQIRRTVTQVVHPESQENGQKEAKRSRHEESEEDDPQGDRERTGVHEEKTDTSFPAPMETQSPSHTSHDVEINTVTTGDTLIRRSISQQKTGVSITIDDPVRSAKQPSPPRGKVSNIVHICNLVRPFTLGQLKELLSRTGTLVEEGFWIDKIKSHCYVTYCSSEEAVATRAALHGVKWPQSNPKVLSVEFCQQDELDFHKGSADRPGAEEHGPGAGRGRALGLPSLLPERDQWAEREREMERREKARAEREWDRDKVKEFGKPGEETEGGPRRSRSREKRRKERGKSKEKKTEKKEKVAEDPPAKLLDDLFRKTKAAPCIYWLPLTEEQFVQREAARADRMKEREKRRKEQEEEDEKKREEERKERMKAGGGPTAERSEGEKEKEKEKDRDRERDRDRDRGRDRERERENDKRRDGYRRPEGRGAGGGPTLTQPQRPTRKATLMANHLMELF
ncbi:apoptotic chromatin condensation inducer in the nucleus isoform X2 [Sebastes umbrosus]|uniref:apoptotic chromatin condensation inducer in the nucleus isoform X2 n=1 Tax=Sebastes umbrosus TaxID=72105 RepID=UPI00189FED04|nr:apoptotic chromatin condensation inducer in the nucleus isoform X2 [Sebastes umbrosus]